MKNAHTTPWISIYITYTLHGTTDFSEKNVPQHYLQSVYEKIMVRNV